jgi:uncharacterized DUF497 family protein
MSRYDWDAGKARKNLAKHGVSFEEAESVPDTDLARWVPDPRYADEDRFLITGTSSFGTLLVVVTSERGPRPRIISARRATKRERHAYETRS